MPLKNLHRTATFAWGTSHDSLPLLATGTVSGALDETFTNVGTLEIWKPQLFDGQGQAQEQGQEEVKGSLTTTARFNRLAWSNPSAKHGRGLLAAGMETGQVSVWDAEKILAGPDAGDAVVFQNEVHTGPVRGLDFNPIQQNLLASGAINAELQVFDLTNPDKTHSTGPRSTKLDEITCIQWNPTVTHVLAASSSSGYTSVWDLRQKREILSMAYGGGAATGMGGQGMARNGGLQVGNKRGMSSVVWHPSNPMKMVTASEDDTSPIVMVWDLRNSLAPEKILSGHDKGILSLSWCAQDPDLLLSCGKDNRTICWNPNTCEIVGELPSSENWSFQTAFSPRNPDLIATASFDGKIGIHSLQNTQENESSIEKTNTDDIFGQHTGTFAKGLSLKQPPKWLRPPVAVSFGFGGQITRVTTSDAGRSVVTLSKVVTEQDVVTRAQKLAAAIDSQEQLGSFCQDMVDQKGEASAVEGWKALKSLFTTNSRDELVTLLGFSKADIADQVSEAIKKFKLTIKSEDDLETPKVEVAEPDFMGDGARTPTVESELDLGSSHGTAPPSETGKSDTEQGGLFDDDVVGTPQMDGGAGAAFFSSIGTIRNALPDHMQIPHQGYAQDSSVAATIGSRASSVASDTMRNNTFKIYPSNESEVDKLITRALVVGDFESAVTLCLSVDRFADALVLAVRGSPDLLARTQKAYFEKRTTSLPYLRLFQSIVSEDLSDVVQNADLTEWQEVFVILCTFAKNDEFNSLTEQLGQRIEFQARVVNGSSGENSTRAKEWRKNALLCYLAAGRLEKAVGIWVDEMGEDEESAGSRSPYTAHAQALQTFIEKVAVFRSATGYTDGNLAQAKSADADAGSRTYLLADLYDRYYEYADLLATQGLTELAVKYIQQTPADYEGSKGGEYGFASVRARHLQGVSPGSQRSIQVPAQSVQPQAPAVPTFGGYQSLSAPLQPAPLVGNIPTTPYNPYGPQSTVQPPVNVPLAPAPGLYTPANVNPYGAAPAPTAYGGVQQQYNAGGAYGAYGQQGRPAVAAAAIVPPPPPMARRSNDSPAPIPAAQRRDIPGWNDAPSLQAPKRTGSAASGKPQAIMSPFPEIQGYENPMQSPMGNQLPSGSFPPPPPSRQTGPTIAPPPRGAQPPRPASSQPPPPPPPPPPPQTQPFSQSIAAPPSRVASTQASQGPIPGPPPARVVSPLVPQQHRVTSPQQQVRPPSAPAGPYQPPPGVRAGPAPPTIQARAPPMAGPRPPAPTSRPSSAAPATKPAPKYPAGDRSHIPESSRPIFEAFSNELSRLSQVVPAQQRRYLDDTQRRLNVLFDGLNCETVPLPIIAQLGEMIKAIAARDPQAALAMHVDMLTRGPSSDDMSVWMSGIKQLIRLGM